MILRTISLYAILLLALQSCREKPPISNTNKLPLIPKDTSRKTERENTLFVFVGEKISVTPLPYEPGNFDSGIEAKYAILQRVYGYCDLDTIVFNAYDHFGTFEFTDYKNVLLYVSEWNGKFYHEKYMFDILFKTKDGRWAGPYSREYVHPYNEDSKLEPERIDFSEEAFFPLKFTDQNREELMTIFDPRYYKMVGDTAIPVYGNYIPELFELKKNGVLTARELFGTKGFQ